MRFTGQSQMSPDFGHEKGKSEIDQGTIEIYQSVSFRQKGQMRLTGQSQMSHCPRGQMRLTGQSQMSLHRCPASPCPQGQMRLTGQSQMSLP